MGRVAHERGESTIDLIHVDGEHSEADVASDLRQADALLTETGVIIVDDYRHPHYPGVASALYRFLESADFRIFLATETKAFICRRAQAADKYEEFDKLLSSQHDIEWCHYHREQDFHGERPRQWSYVLASPVLFCTGKASVYESKIQKQARYRVRRVARDWLPPAILRALRRGDRSSARTDSMV